MSHITLEQRYEIAAMLNVGNTLEHIGIHLGLHRSSISREVKRNRDMRSGRYYPQLAQRKCTQRHTDKPKRLGLNKTVRENIEELIREGLSPEQVTGVCKKNNVDCVSHETIYKLIWSDKKANGDLFTYLRRRGRRYRKRGGAITGRGLLVDRVGIEKRPERVELKQDFGDLEVDTIVGKNHLGAIVTINDRASGMLRMKRTPTREAREVGEAINELLKDWIPYIRTITADNGKEFAGHREVAENCRVDFYFADPYCSWQRGANENLNGLIRQYFPKKTDFSTITDEQVQRIQDKLNNRPRKRYKFATPLEKMEKLLFNNQVAFMT
jgi:IS30 family transposase